MTDFEYATSLIGKYFCERSWPDTRKNIIATITDVDNSGDLVILKYVCLENANDDPMKGQKCGLSVRYLKYMMNDGIIRLISEKEAFALAL